MGIIGVVVLGLVIAAVAGYWAHISDVSKRNVKETEARLAAQREFRSGARYKSGFWSVALVAFIVVFTVAALNE